jgi:mRNA-degrading endonuclease HigB of HigAB toxin-antitoxin module
MRLVGREKLDVLKGKDPEAHKWTRSWASEIIDAHWRRPEDVAAQFPNARHQGQGCFHFPIGNCPFVIQLRIAFAQGIALISDLQTTK